MLSVEQVRSLFLEHPFHLPPINDSGEPTILWYLFPNHTPQLEFPSESTSDDIRRISRQHITELLCDSGYTQDFIDKTPFDVYIIDWPVNFIPRTKFS